MTFRLPLSGFQRYFPYFHNGLTNRPRRNFTCIGCGCPRPSSSHTLSTPRTSLPTINPALVPSPRFAGAPEPHMPASHKIPHILTPSGRAFSIGGRVQDVSSDPLYSCFMFWPDNEPLPEQGQIRPSNLFGAPVRIALLIVKLCLISWHS